MATTVRKFTDTDWFYSEPPACLEGLLMAVASSDEGEELIVFGVGKTVVTVHDQRRVICYDLSDSSGVTPYINKVLKNQRDSGNEVKWFKANASGEGLVLQYRAAEFAGSALVRGVPTSKSRPGGEFEFDPDNPSIVDGGVIDMEDDEDLLAQLGITDDPPKPKRNNKPSQEPDWHEESAAPHRRRSLKAKDPEKYLATLMGSSRA